MMQRNTPLLILLALHIAACSSLSSHRPALRHIHEQQQQQQQQRPQSTFGLLNLQNRAALDGCGLLALRGGSDDVLPDPTKEEDKDTLTLPTEDDGIVSSSPMASCMAGVRKILGMLMSLLSPSHEYAKAGSDLLGNTQQMSGYAPDDESWRTQRKKLNEVELQGNTRKRVLRDLRMIKKETDLGLEVEDCECLTDWVIKLVGAKGTVYEGEIYRLRVRFHADYPSQPPEVTFMRPAPVHEHIYSDGKICLNILYNDWDPKLDVKSVCLSLLSMLSSAKGKKRPPDNDSTVVMSQGQKTRNMQWEFHDDKC